MTTPHQCNMTTSSGLYTVGSRTTIANKATGSKQVGGKQVSPHQPTTGNNNAMYQRQARSETHIDERRTTLGDQDQQIRRQNKTSPQQGSLHQEHHFESGSSSSVTISPGQRIAPSIIDGRYLRDKKKVQAVEARARGIEHVDISRGSQRN